MNGISPAERFSREIGRHAVTAALFVLFWAYVWLIVQPRLLYHYQCPVFMTGAEYLKRFTPWPGGLAEYASLFLAQACRYPLLGALVVTATAWVICEASARLFRSVGGPVHPAVSVFPAVLLLALLQRYSDHLVTSVALSTALGSFAAYAWFPRGQTWLRLTAFAVLAAVLFHVIGGMVVLFGALCAVHELASRRSIAGAFACAAVAAALPIAFGLYSYDVTVVDALKPLVPFRRLTTAFSGYLALPADDRWGPSEWSGGLHWTLMLFFPLGTVLSAMRGRFALARAECAPNWSVRWVAAFLALAAALLWASSDGDRKTRILIDHYGAQDQWEKVLRAARRLDPSQCDRFVMHEVNRALYHTGRLPDEMFSFPQRLEEDALLLAGMDSQKVFATYLKASKVLLEMGQVNYAEEWAQMALEALGERPPILQQLIRINVLRDRLPIARILLRRLERNLVHRAWARDYLARLEEAPAGEWDPLVQRARLLMPSERDGVQDVAPGVPVASEEVLFGLLHANSSNRMVFEYLTAMHLLARRSERIPPAVMVVDAWAPGGPIPRSYEEALLVFLRDPAHRDPGFLADPGNRLLMDIAQRHVGAVSEATRARMEDFRSLYRAYHEAIGDARTRAFRELIAREGDSYFFYYTFGFSVVEPSKPASNAKDAP